MKKIFAIAFVLILFGCEENTSDPSNINVDAESVSTSGIDEVCGKEKKCSQGLECLRNEDDPLTGTCIDSVVDKELVCPETQAPVCGIKNNIKNGYLNECEARRHGAFIANEGFCKKNEKVIGMCSSFIQAIGNCEKLIVGYEFNGETCSEKKVVGCDADIPFESMEACNEKCVDVSN